MYQVSVAKEKKKRKGIQLFDDVSIISTDLTMISMHLGLRFCGIHDTTSYEIASLFPNFMERPTTF